MTVQVLFLTGIGLIAGGCASEPVPIPDPPPVVFYDCRVPSDLFADRNAPVPPRGEYTQRDVARYVVNLDAWGRAGWQRVAAIKAWTAECVDGH